MKTHVTRRIPIAVAVCLALAALALGFPASASPDAPNPGHAWTELENHGIDAGNYWLGTTGSEALELRVNNARVLRLEPGAWSPNVIGGYTGNSVASGVSAATIGGGGSISDTNRVTDLAGTVAGGTNNQAGDNAGTTSDASGTSVGGGWSNTASGPGATIGGGSLNSASGVNATIGGGAANSASNNTATVGGGYSNAASGIYATVGGGDSNAASGGVATVAGGVQNTASSDSGTVGGGFNNHASATFATIAGGTSSEASGEYATVGGGGSNTASGPNATVGGGVNNTAISGSATVPGGDNNTAGGGASFAAGHRAKANDNGAFVWADFNDFDFFSTTANEFSARSTGGARFVLGIDGSGNPTWTCSVANGGTWSCSSARALKENLVAADGRDILERLSEVSLFTWNAKGQDPSARHIGPMAEDFYAAFGVGDDDGRISTIDLDGVALAAIQGLYELSQEQAARIEALEEENATLQQRLDDLETRVSALEEGPGANALVSRASSSGLPTTWLLLGGGLALALGGLVLVQRRLAGARR